MQMNFDQKEYIIYTVHAKTDFPPKSTLKSSPQKYSAQKDKVNVCLFRTL